MTDYKPRSILDIKTAERYRREYELRKTLITGMALWYRSLGNTGAASCPLQGRSVNIATRNIDI